MTLRSNLDCVCLLLGQWIKLDITILSTIVVLNVFFTVLVVLLCQSEFCQGLWIKSCGLVNCCSIRAIVKIKMVLKVCCTETFRQDLRRGRQASCWITLWALWMIALQRTKIYQSIKDR